MNPLLEVLSQGEEIVTGQVVDSNAAWLSQEAVVMGFSIARHTAVGDKLDDLIQILSEISARADCCICTGGLGPTSDDLTAEAVSKAFGRSLVFDETAYQQIQQFFEKRQRQMPESNRKQAMLPESAIRLDNHWGTAPGFALKHGRCWFWFVPGVPSEMQQLFTVHVKPMMANQFTLLPSKLVTIKTVGIGESALQDRINAISIPDEVQLGFRAEVGQVQTKLLFPWGFPQLQLESFANLIADTIGDSVYSIEGLGSQSADLVSVVDRLITASRKTIAIVETASQGQLSAKLQGAIWLTSAFYYPSIEKLIHGFEVENKSDDFLETAKAVACAVQKTTGADMVLIQLIDEQLKGNQEKELATSMVNILFDQGKFLQGTISILGDVNRKQQLAALSALDFLRRYLQDNR
jgi:nicotinamide-nucleotide amidase